MPSHQDRVRRNYEESKKTVITFKGIPIHTCDKAPKDPPLHILTPDMEICPFCLEKIDRT